ncbi:MAG: purine-nucleoside phosphorylase [Acidimicrobiia bacterium]|nr:MAG: purine-nucleoside phosphorylase [Acidimicrobiia bacterium]
MTTDPTHALHAAAVVIAARTGVDNHDAAIVLGSGLSEYARTLDGAIEIPYQEIPGFSVPQVAGHGGILLSVPMGDKRLLVLAGRVHAYEGFSMNEVVFGIRAAVSTGARNVMLTNASGGIGEQLSPGDLVIISDHLNLTGKNPLTGPNDDRIGPRFPDMSEVYSPDLRESLASVFTEVGLTPHEGVYAWFLGPSYETPAEVQMAKRLGADLVGMSTVPEAIAARHMGATVVAVSLVTNLAAGISLTPLSHAEVTHAAAKATSKFTSILDRFLPILVSMNSATLSYRVGRSHRDGSF